MLNLQEENQQEEDPETYCIERNQVVCEVYFNGAAHKFHVHLACWENFELRQICRVVKYEQNTQHLAYRCPFKGCAHCGENIYRPFVSNLCDTCVLLGDL